MRGDTLEPCLLGDDQLALGLTRTRNSSVISSAL